MSENRHTIYKTCPNCGAHLDPGERCDCMADGMHPLPRDGLRAMCPYFVQRIDHQGSYRIQCVTRRRGSLMPQQDGLYYPGRQERDDDYKRRCCQGGDCEIRAAWDKEENR